MVSPCYLVMFHLTHHVCPDRNNIRREFFQRDAPRFFLTQSPSQSLPFLSKCARVGFSRVIYSDVLLAFMRFAYGNVGTTRLDILMIC